jgi:GT2 family glycosyltransferase
MPNVKVSVLVATCNRAQSLRQLVDSFEAMAPSTKTPWELIVIDNNSTDATRAVAEEAKQRGIVPLTYVFEARRGKGIALNEGLARSSGDLVAFTDDDCVVDPGWIDAIAKEFTDNPTLGGLGGRVVLHDPRDAPIATRTSRDRRKVGLMGQNYCPIIGCNMALRRSVLEEIGGFDPLVGPGSPIPSGQDTDIVYRAFRAGFPLEYTPDVLVRHDHGRRTREDVEEVTRRYLTGRGAYYSKYLLEGDWRILVLAAQDLLAIAAESARTVLGGRPPRGPVERLRHLVRGFRLGTAVRRARAIPAPPPTEASK